MTRIKMIHSQMFLEFGVLLMWSRKGSKSKASTLAHLITLCLMNLTKGMVLRHSSQWQSFHFYSVGLWVVCILVNVKGFRDAEPPKFKYLLTEGDPLLSFPFVSLEKCVLKIFSSFIKLKWLL